MDPEERTYASTLRACWHLLRYLEVCEPCPHTSLIHTEDSEVLWLHIRRLVLIRNRQRTPRQIIEALRMVCLRTRVWAHVVEFVGVTDVAALGGGEEGCSAFITSDFGCGGLSCGQFVYVARVWRVSEVIVEPPFREGHIHERRYGTIVIRKRLVGNVEPEHARVPERYEHGESAIDQLRKTYPAHRNGHKH